MWAAAVAAGHPTSFPGRYPSAAGCCFASRLDGYLQQKPCAASKSSRPLLPPRRRTRPPPGHRPCRRAKCIERPGLRGDAPDRTTHAARTCVAAGPRRRERRLEAPIAGCVLNYAIRRRACAGGRTLVPVFLLHEPGWQSKNGRPRANSVPFACPGAARGLSAGALGPTCRDKAGRGLARAGRPKTVRPKSGPDARRRGGAHVAGPPHTRPARRRCIASLCFSRPQCRRQQECSASRAHVAWARAQQARRHGNAVVVAGAGALYSYVLRTRPAGSLGVAPADVIVKESSITGAWAGGGMHGSRGVRCHCSTCMMCSYNAGAGLGLFAAKDLPSGTVLGMPMCSCARAYMRARFARTHPPTQPPTYTHKHTHTHTTPPSARSHARTHARMHARTHKQTNTHTHTHTHCHAPSPRTQAHILGVSGGLTPGGEARVCCLPIISSTRSPASPSSK